MENQFRQKAQSSNAEALPINDSADSSLDLYQTKRVTSETLENLLLKEIKVLDHGFVRVVDYMGCDSAVVQAARVSYGKGTKQVSQDKGLINYLMRHKHTTPFEMCDIKFHIKLPIFVARQWIRHRTASVNEYSARYSILSKEFYIPEIEHLSAQSLTNKQGRGGAISATEASRVLDMLRNDASSCYSDYIDMLNENENGDIIDQNKSGIARELARMNLTLNYYTEWYWKINLHNLLHFLALRSHHHSQYEIRAYAIKMLDIVKAWVPLTYEAFEEHVLYGKHFSRSAISVIKRLIAGEKVTKENSNMTTREWGELQDAINLTLE